MAAARPSAGGGWKQGRVETRAGGNKGGRRTSMGGVQKRDRIPQNLFNDFSDRRVGRNISSDSLARVTHFGRLSSSAARGACARELKIECEVSGPDTRPPQGEHSGDETEMMSSPTRHNLAQRTSFSYSRALSTCKFRLHIVHNVISSLCHIVTSYADSNGVTKIPHWRNQIRV